MIGYIWAYIGTSGYIMQFSNPYEHLGEEGICLSNGTPLKIGVVTRSNVKVFPEKNLLCIYDNWWFANSPGGARFSVAVEVEIPKTATIKREWMQMQHGTLEYVIASEFVPKEIIIFSGTAIKPDVVATNLGLPNSVVRRQRKEVVTDYCWFSKTDLEGRCDVCGKKVTGMFYMSASLSITSEFGGGVSEPLSKFGHRTCLKRYLDTKIDEKRKVVDTR